MFSNLNVCSCLGFWVQIMLVWCLVIVSYVYCNNQGLGQPIAGQCFTSHLWFRPAGLSLVRISAPGRRPTQHAYNTNGMQIMCRELVRLKCTSDFFALSCVGFLDFNSEDCHVWIVVRAVQSTIKYRCCPFAQTLA